MFSNLIKKQWTMLLLLTVLVGNSKVWAQQEKMFSQYMFNMLALNPAYAGSRDVLSATGMYRNQWGGIEGAPKTGTFTIDSPISSERVGLGFTAFNDQLGGENHTGFYGSYAFRIKLGERTTLALGLQGGVTNFRWSLTDVVLSPGGATNDPAFANNIVKWLPNFGTGVYLSNDRGYLGLSVPYLMENNLTTFDSGDMRAKQRRHYYMMAGFVVGKNAVKIKPSMLVKYVNTKEAPIGLDGNVNVWFHDRIAVGASYRYNRFVFYGDQSNRGDAVVGLFELQLNEQLRFGYSYDYTTSSLNHSKAFLSVPTHEIMLRYEFGSSKSKILTPRYF
jgi:type IX secretion system PorP/SprF family membrane protein